MKTFSKSPGTEALLEVNCSLCGGKNTRRLYEKDSLWVRCRECGLVYQDPQPVQNQLLDRYDDEYFRYEIENEAVFFDLMRKGLSDIDFRMDSRQEHESRVFVDVGCATGMLLEWAKSNGWSEQGVEVCKPAAEYGRTKRGVNIFIGSLEDARLEAESVDVVHCSHLIEHLTDPSGFVREVGRILRPDGVFIATTPNIDGFQARLFKTEWRSLIADHLFLFSVRTLRRLLESNGFRVIRKKTWGGLGVGSAPAWIKRPADRLAKLLGVGDVMIMLARRSQGLTTS